MSSEKVCPISKLEKLLLATDRSTFCEGAEREAIHFAKKCSTRLYIMTVPESNPEYETIGSNFFRKEEEEARKFLETLKGKALQEGVGCEAALHGGNDPYRQIVDEAAGREADMIVIGTYGKTGVTKLLMGSSTEKVVGLAGCAVLAVKA